MRETYVPQTYLQSLLKQAKEAGCDVPNILKQCNLAQEDIDRQTEISSRRYSDVYRLVMLETQNEWFGIFSGGDRVPLGAFRMMALTLLQCSNLRQALYRASDFAEICRGMSSRNILSVEDRVAKLTLSPIRSLPESEFEAALKEASAESILTSFLTWHRFSEWLIDKEIPLLQVNVTHLKQEDYIPLAHRSLSNIQFGCAENSMHYAEEYLDYPVVQGQETLAAFLRTAPYHLVTQDPTHTSSSEKVRSMLNRDVSGSMPSAEEVAKQLNVSVTTLRRQLQREGTSFQRIKDKCRLEAAYHYLNYAELSNSDVAEKLGFDEPSAFFRSFKKWTGMTPGEYRESLK